MNEEQLRLMAYICIGLVTFVDLIEPYYIFSADVGRCRYCNETGKLKNAKVELAHKETCILSYAQKLHASLTEEKKEQGE